VSEPLQIWLFAGGFGLIGIIGAALLHHMLHCKGNTESITDLKTDLKDNVKPEINKLRDRSHEMQNSILKMDARVSVLEERTK
jgi:hypothetical protein